MKLLMLAVAAALALPVAAQDRSLVIKRDTYGVPHVYANDVLGLFHGYGYVVAEDRLFQMEMARRAVLGTVSEVLGATYIPLDKSSRMSFDSASIRAQLDRLSPEDRDIFEGYAAGFNARIREVIADKGRLMPKQFLDAGFAPSAWTAFDVVMVWVGTMANRYSNVSSEVANLRLLDQLKKARGDAVGRQLFDQLVWTEDPLAPTTVPRHPSASTAPTGPSPAVALAPVSPDILTAAGDIDAAHRGVARPWERPVASNVWIAGPHKTADGSTVLVNGPQFNWFNPSYVFGIGLHGAGFDVTGNTPFAYPVVLFGTNGQIAWGATAGPLDVNDMYQEKLDPADPHAYAYQGALRPMGRRTETIQVKGQADQRFEIYSTVHGVVTNFDLPNQTAYAMKRSWDGFEVESLLGWIHSMQAKNWDQWMAQAARVAITINWYYADVQGHIGYVSPGRLPQRPASQDIRLPALGDGSMEWVGIRPFSENPRVLDPAQGYIANWNNQSAVGAVSDGGNYGAADRVNEITARLEAKAQLSPQELWELNRTVSFADTNIRYLLPFITEATKGLSADTPPAQAARILSSWNALNQDPAGTGMYDSPATTLVMAWLPIVYKKLLQDDLPPEVFASYATAGYAGANQVASIRPGNGTRLLLNALLGAQAGVPQVYDFFNGENPQAVLRSTLTQAMAQLTAQFGADVGGWRTPVAPHIFLAKNFIGAPQASSDEILTLPVFMNRGSQNDQIVLRTTGASMCTVAPPGQSGFVAPNGEKSRHYADQLALFKDFGCKPEWLTPAELDKNLESTTRLTY